MTHNQIEYWKLQEQKQHNTATRAETARTNLANEAIARDRNVETNRHNVRVEAIDQYKAEETERSNRAREYETNRSNLATESLRDREVAYKESILPSEIAKNYSYLGKNTAGLISDIFKTLPIFALARDKKTKGKDDNSNSSSGSGAKQPVVHAATNGSRYVSPRTLAKQEEEDARLRAWDELLDELDKQHEKQAEEAEFREKWAELRKLRQAYINQQRAEEVNWWLDTLDRVQNGLETAAGAALKALTFLGIPASRNNVNSLTNAFNKIK